MRSSINLEQVRHAQPKASAASSLTAVHQRSQGVKAVRHLSGDPYPPADAEELPWRLIQLQPLLQLLPGVIIAIDVNDVAAMMKVSVSAVWAMCDPSSRSYDSKFPKPTKHRVLRRTLWRFDAVQAYMRELFNDE